MGQADGMGQVDCPFRGKATYPIPTWWLTTDHEDRDKTGAQLGAPTGTETVCLSNLGAVYGLQQARRHGVEESG